MFQGSNVHYSPIDHKPLCSYSVKLCKQRRLNGYAFCVRHILEDPTAPFKQCDYVLNGKAGQQRCTNAIPNDKERRFCNSHMQVMGIIPKKERKNKAKEKTASSHDLDTATFSLESRLPSRFSLTRTNSKFAADKAISDPDDPYAFPDTEPAPVQQSAYSPGHAGGDFSPGVGKVDPGGFSAAKLFPELAEKLERATAGKTKLEPKVKGAKSSRTMNRLQTRIAQNRIKDKMKRQEGSSQGTTPEYQPSTPQTPVSQPFCVDNSQRFYFDSRVKPNMAGGRLCNGSVFPGNNFAGNGSVTGNLAANSFSKSLQALGSANGAVVHRQLSIPRSHSRLRRQNSILSEAEVKKRLKRDSAVAVYRYHAMKKAYNADLLTFGPDDSESDSDEDLLPWQPAWFSVSSDEEDQDDQEESSHSSRMVNLSLLKTRLRRQFSQLRKSQLANVTMRLYDTNASQSLVKAAKESAVCARRAVAEINRTDIRKRTKSKSKKISKTCLERRSCLYTKEEENWSCSNTALPFTNHCVKHILYNVDQQLFDYCTGKFGDYMQCCLPVFDPLHEYPVCLDHSSQAVTLEALPETPLKRPRKKPKPLALLRPAKKKKKNNRRIRPQKPMPSLEPTGDTAMPVTPTMVSAPESTLQFPTRDVHSGVNTDAEESDLSPGAIDRSLELPLEEEKLLDDHELNDVLNKIPAEAFNDFFSGKNGASDELEQALSANLSKETLDAMTKDVMMDDGDEGELPKHIADAILQQQDELETSLQNIASSFSSSDFKAISQSLNGPLMGVVDLHHHHQGQQHQTQFVTQGSLPASQVPSVAPYVTYTSAPTIQALLQRPPMTVDHHGGPFTNSNVLPPGSQAFVNSGQQQHQQGSLHIPQHVNSPINSHSPTAGGHAPSPHAATGSPLSHQSPHHQVQSPMASPLPGYQRPTWPASTTYQNGYPAPPPSSGLPPYPQGNLKYQYAVPGAPADTAGFSPTPLNSAYPAGTGIASYSGYEVRTPLPPYAGLPPANS